MFGTIRYPLIAGTLHSVPQGIIPSYGQAFGASHGMKFRLLREQRGLAGQTATCNKEVFHPTAINQQFPVIKTPSPPGGGGRRTPAYTG